MPRLCASASCAELQVVHQLLRDLLSVQQVKVLQVVRAVQLGFVLEESRELLRKGIEVVEVNGRIGTRLSHSEAEEFWLFIRDLFGSELWDGVNEPVERSVQPLLGVGPVEAQLNFDSGVGKLFCKLELRLLGVL